MTSSNLSNENSVTVKGTEVTINVVDGNKDTLTRTDIRAIVKAIQDEIDLKIFVDKLSTF